jgi:hypothetical protein
MSAPTSDSGFQAAMLILSHVYFAPILGTPIRARVPDLLEGGAVHSLVTVWRLHTEVKAAIRRMACDGLNCHCRRQTEWVATRIVAYQAKVILRTPLPHFVNYQRILGAHAAWRSSDCGRCDHHCRGVGRRAHEERNAETCV